MTADLRKAKEGKTNDNTARGERLHGRTGDRGSYREDKGKTGVKFELKLGLYERGQGYAVNRR